MNIDGRDYRDTLTIIFDEHAESIGMTWYQLAKEMFEHPSSLINLRQRRREASVAMMDKILTKCGYTLQLVKTKPKVKAE